MATNDKYDRQLRLWGADGQHALATAKVLCLGSSALATETIKNIVLPGVGSFTIVDDAVVSSEDLSGNFFLELSDLGHPRAAAVVPRLTELNPDVRGEFVVASPAAYVRSCDSAQYDLVVVANVSIDTSLLLERFPASVEVLSAGFLGSVRLYSKEHIVRDARKEEGNFPDLRLHDAWEELLEYSDSINLALLDDKEHGHIPWAVILLKALQKLQGQADVASLKTGVLEMRRSTEEENFREALESLHVVLHGIQGALSDETSELFERINQVKDEKFKCVVLAIRDFYSRHGRLPLSGKVPDMTADTQRFLKLQRVYQDKAEKDVQEILGSVDEFPEYARKLVKHAGDLRVLSFDVGNGEDFRVEDEDESTQEGLRIYKALKKAGGPEGELGEEIRRSEDIELHTVCAIIGGIAAQEVTKLLTHIFTPLDNLFVFNGANGEGCTLRIVV